MRWQSSGRGVAMVAGALAVVGVGVGASDCGSGAEHRGPAGAIGAGGSGGGFAATAGTSGAASSPADAAGVAGTGAEKDAAGDGALGPCDRNGDGLDDAPACVTAPVTLRFVNASAAQTVDVWLTGAAAPVTTGLPPYGVFTVGPVQARALDLQLRRASGTPATLRATPTGNTHDTIVAYDLPTSPATPGAAWAPQPQTGDCSGSSADVAFGDFTTLLPAPVIVFYATNGGADWTPVLSPGLAVGQIFGSGCWNADTSVAIGAGPAGTTRAGETYRPTSFAALQSYQLLLTDARIIQIDGLDRVSYLARASSGSPDAGADARD